jgi:hypothetical protein
MAGAEENQPVKPTKLDIAGGVKWFRDGVVRTHALDA